MELKINIKTVLTWIAICLVPLLAMAIVGTMIKFGEFLANAKCDPVGYGMLLALSGFAGIAVAFGLALSKLNI